MFGRSNPRGTEERTLSRFHLLLYFFSEVHGRGEEELEEYF